MNRAAHLRVIEIFQQEQCPDRPPELPEREVELVFVLSESRRRRIVEGVILPSLSDTATRITGKLVHDILAGIAEFERSLIRERTMAGLAAARERGRLGGRPPALKPEDLQAARALLKDPSITVAQVAERLKVSASTLYKHIPAARASAPPD